MHKNRIHVRGDTTGSWGIAVLADGATVTDNQVTLASPTAVGLSVSGSHNRVIRNRVDGSGAAGILVAPIFTMKASVNEIADNDLALLRASMGAITLMKGADRNRVTGSSGNVRDAGEGNDTGGLKRVGLE